jgi:[methyl-Co(III) methanol-specific corrinoid protein]:coenzyme M methyltransferase
MRLFEREPVDTMPCFSGMGMVAVQAIKEMGIRFAEVHTSAENLARSAMLTAEMFGFDAVVIPYDMCTVPEALGRGVSLYRRSGEISKMWKYPRIFSAKAACPWLTKRLIF